MNKAQKLIKTCEEEKWFIWIKGEGNHPFIKRDTPYPNKEAAHKAAMRIVKDAEKKRLVLYFKVLPDGEEAIHGKEQHGITFGKGSRG